MPLYKFLAVASTFLTSRQEWLPHLSRNCNTPDSRQSQNVTKAAFPLDSAFSPDSQSVKEKKNNNSTLSHFILVSRFCCCQYILQNVVSIR